MKTITLCADDYGLHPTTSSAILELAERGIIQATSCLTTMGDWSHAAAQLKPLAGQMDIGLHLNFTEGAGLSRSWVSPLPSVPVLLLKSYATLLSMNTLIEEVTAQYEMFLEAFGQAPDFIDGHQHVHHFPVIREALLTAISQFRQPAHFWIRSVSPLSCRRVDLKSFVIEHSGAKELREQLECRGITTNSSFAGIYSMQPNQPFRTLMKGWLKNLSDHGLIMCHPANHRINSTTSSANDLPDHSPARQIEFDYLSHESFLQDCQEANITLSTLRP